MTLSKTPAAPSTRPAEKITTEVAAPRLTVKPQTMRAAHCRDGHYMNIVPVKLPNGRLLWDADAVDALIAGRTVKADPEKIDEHVARKAAADESKIPAHIRAKSEAKAKRLTAGEAA